MKGKGDFSSSKKGWSWGKRKKIGFMGFLWRDLEEKRRSEKGTIAARTVQDAICIGMDITITCLSAESDHLWICSFFSLILGCIDIFPLLSSRIHSWIWCLVIKYIYFFSSFFTLASLVLSPLIRNMKRGSAWFVLFLFFLLCSIFRIPFSLSDICSWGFFWKLLERRIRIWKDEMERSRWVMQAQ